MERRAWPGLATVVCRENDKDKWRISFSLQRKEKRDIFHGGAGPDSPLRPLLEDSPEGHFMRQFRADLFRPAAAGSRKMDGEARGGRRKSLLGALASPSLSPPGTSSGRRRPPLSADLSRTLARARTLNRNFSRWPRPPRASPRLSRKLAFG